MLFDPYTLGQITLTNRTVMAPMTRCRAVEHNTPNALMAEYYQQRAGAGLIVTEGTSPSPNGLGYARIPGLFNQAQVQGWRGVTHAVHQAGGHIFVQLMHTGRVSHQANLPAGARVIGPSPEVCPGNMWTDGGGMLPHTPPAAMTGKDINEAIAEYVQAAKLAVEASFDGIELHAANGYLLEQFLNANVNLRTDDYGGGIEQRNRFVLEVAAACVAAIGGARVGIRLSPYGVFNATGAYPHLEAQYLALVDRLSALGLVYLHLVDHSAQGAPEVPAGFKAQLRAAFSGTFIASGGYNGATAEQALQDNHGDLVAFGRPFLANPDLVRRLQTKAPFNELDMTTFYTPAAQGYTDYPALD